MKCISPLVVRMSALSPGLQPTSLDSAYHASGRPCPRTGPPARPRVPRLCQLLQLLAAAGSRTPTASARPSGCCSSSSGPHGSAARCLVLGRPERACRNTAPSTPYTLRQRRRTELICPAPCHPLVVCKVRYTVPDRFSPGWPVLTRPGGGPLLLAHAASLWREHRGAYSPPASMWPTLHRHPLDGHVGHPAAVPTVITVSAGILPKVSGIVLVVPPLLQGPVRPSARNGCSVLCNSGPMSYGAPVRQIHPGSPPPSRLL